LGEGARDDHGDYPHARRPGGLGCLPAQARAALRRPELRRRAHPMTRPVWRIPAGYRTSPPRLNMADEVVDRPVRNGLGAAPAIWYDGGMLTREDLRRRVDAFARGLSRLGVGQGETVLLRSSNR